MIFTYTCRVRRAKILEAELNFSLWASFVTSLCLHFCLPMTNAVTSTAVMETAGIFQARTYPQTIWGLICVMVLNLHKSMGHE